MRIAVLMTCHNRCPKTIDCLRHLYNNKRIEGLYYDVYLVDDGCTDGTPIIVKQSYSSVNIIEGDGSLFWNRGMCLAWETSRKVGKYDGVLWLNDDTLLEENALEVIYDYAIKYPDSNIIASVSSTDCSKLTYGGFQKGKLVTPNNELQLCDKFNGNCVFVPSSVSEKIGYLDPYYRHSKGDTDYALRSNKAGIKNIIAPIIGICDRNPLGPIWGKGTLVQRYKKLYSPLGNNPFEIFHICRKTSLLKAIWKFIYIHIRVLMTFVIPQKVVNVYKESTDSRYKK